MNILILSLVVFAITLTATKSKVFAATRFFVKERYEAAFVNGQTPNWFHKFWHQMWHCPMCLGFWVSAVVCLLMGASGYVINVLAVYGLNWLWHCLENFLFFGGEYFEKKSGKSENSKPT